MPSSSSFPSLITDTNCFGGVILGGVVILIVMSVRWSLAWSARHKPRKSVCRGSQNYLVPSGRGKSFLSADAVAALPSVAFIMPVKWGSIKAATPRENWKSQIMSAYAGIHESIFVVEHAGDGAVDIIKSLQLELEGRAKIKLVVAGDSIRCTQKIHNMLKGVSACENSIEYVLFMDANAQVHPGTVSTLVNELMSDSSVFAATGYPLDIPPRSSSIWAWTLCQFRYAALSEFAGNRSDIIWGGCMLMRKADIDNDVCGLKTCWTNGGYSDDMLVGACAAAGGKAVATPLRAIFPNQIKKDVRFAHVWDFLRRQIFVLTTFQSSRNCRKHSCLMFAYSFFNTFVAVSFELSTLVLICSFIRCSEKSMIALNFISACSFYAMLLVTVIVEKRHLQSSIKLTSALSPEASHLDASHISVFILLLSFVLQVHLAAPVSICSICRRSIVWGDITYFVRKGQVVRIVRPEKPQFASMVWKQSNSVTTEMASFAQ